MESFQKTALTGTSPAFPSRCFHSSADHLQQSTAIYFLSPRYVQHNTDKDEIIRVFLAGKLLLTSSSESIIQTCRCFRGDSHSPDNVTFPLSSKLLASHLKGVTAANPQASVHSLSVISGASAAPSVLLISVQGEAGWQAWVLTGQCNKRVSNVGI